MFFVRSMKNVAAVQEWTYLSKIRVKPYSLRLSYTALIEILFCGKWQFNSVSVKILTYFGSFLKLINDNLPFKWFATLSSFHNFFVLLLWSAISALSMLNIPALNVFVLYKRNHRYWMVKGTTSFEAPIGCCILRLEKILVRWETSGVDL